MSWLHSALLLFLRISWSNGTGNTNNGCAPRSYGEGKIVCVCSEDYCDEWGDIELIPKGGYLEYTSSRSGLRLEKKSGTFTEWNTEEDSILQNEILKHDVKLILKRDMKYQKILGFGGAFTDASGINIRKLPDTLQNSLIESYYGQKGIGYSISRVPIGGSDFSPRPYTYNDGPEDVLLSNFSLQEEDYAYKIPYIKMAKSLYPSLKLLASPWTAPPWMKTNNDYWGRGLLRDEYFQSWADYFVKFLRSYEDESIKIWGVTTQNEPLDGLVPFFPFNSMGWTSSKMRDWIKGHLGPTLKREEFSHIKIITLDENTVALPTWLDGILSDNEAASYVDGIGIHWYSNFWTKHQPINATHHSHPDKFILATEACSGFLPWEWEKVSLGSWDRGEAYAEDIIKDLQNWVVGWLDWNIALNPEGGPNWAKHAADSPIIVNSTSKEFYKQPMFYAMAHISKFIIPDSRVLLVNKIANEINEDEDILSVAAERPDGAMTLILLNKKDREVSIQLVDEKRGYGSVLMPSRSITSLLYR